MKVLIVEDSDYKLNETIALLQSLGLDNYDVASNTMEGILSTSKNNYDLLISDLGLPLRKGEEVKSPIEGLSMLEMLALRGVLIPTIINSTTPVSEEDLELLVESELPYLGQATNITELKSLIESFLNSRSETSNDNLGRTRTNSKSLAS